MRLICTHKHITKMYVKDFSKTVAVYMWNNFFLQQTVLLQDNSVSSAIKDVCLCCPSRGWVAQGQVMFSAVCFLFTYSVCLYLCQRVATGAQAHRGRSHRWDCPASVGGSQFINKTLWKAPRHLSDPSFWSESDTDWWMIFSAFYPFCYIWAGVHLKEVTGCL